MPLVRLGHVRDIANDGQSFRPWRIRRTAAPARNDGPHEVDSQERNDNVDNCQRAGHDGVLGSRCEGKGVASAESGRRRQGSSARIKEKTHHADCREYIFSEDGQG